MLGMEDNIVAVGWLATVGSAIGCVIFGVIMWRKGGEGPE